MMRWDAAWEAGEVSRAVSSWPGLRGGAGPVPPDVWVRGAEMYGETARGLVLCVGLVHPANWDAYLAEVRVTARVAVRLAGLAVPDVSPCPGCGRMAHGSVRRAYEAGWLDATCPACFPAAVEVCAAGALDVAWDADDDEDDDEGGLSGAAHGCDDCSRSYGPRGACRCGGAR